MIYITGDAHGNFEKVYELCERFETTKDDVLVILGDAGINYYKPDNNGTKYLKKKLASLPITLFCIHGNHECRPNRIDSYVEKEWNGGIVYVEKKYPNILFAKDGEVFTLNDKKCLVVGGAYSVDKYYRYYRYLQLVWEPEIIQNIMSDLADYISGGTISPEILEKINNYIDNADEFGMGWWKDEQPDENIKKKVLETVAKHDGKFDYVFSHTCPKKFLPYDAFLSGINQDSVDSSTEDFLNIVYANIECKEWFCGHYHLDRTRENMNFLFNDIRTLDEAYDIQDF